MGGDDTALVRMDSPVGRIEVTADDDGVTSLTIAGRDGALPHDADGPERPDPTLESARRQLQEYFAGSRHDFELPLAPHGTPFQRSVWDLLTQIGWGRHTSYGALARELSSPKASRAVGAAVGANPLPILIGCHRVLGATGLVTGYSGGEGVPTKLWLLEHEGIEWAA